MSRAGLLRQRWKPGNIVQISLEDRSYAFGLILESEVAFYNYILMEQNLPCNIDILKQQKIAFIISVMKNCLTQFWPIIGKIKYDSNTIKSGDLYIRDTISNTYRIWKENGHQISATWEECKNLECFSVWECGAVEQRLRDYFARRPCWYLENKKPDWEFIPIKKFYAQYGYDFTFLDNDQS